MIAPNMATMLSVITTDVPLTSRACDAVLRAACATSFNRVSIDSDTSTNDTVVLLASGAAGGAPDRCRFARLRRGRRSGDHRVHRTRPHARA